MFGTYRYLLASMVALSHIGISVGGQNIGVIAVIGFYVLSGYVMIDLIDTRYRGLVDFYIRRARRIFPLYYAALVLAALLYFLGADSPFVSASPDLWGWVSNVSLIPLNYYMYNGIDTFTLIPPAWSLALEVQYYILIPFIIFYAPRYLYLLIFMGSASLFLAAQFQWIPTEYYGYRLLPGMLVMFMSGGILSRIRRGCASVYEYMLLVVFTILVLLNLLYSIHTEIHVPFNQESAIGLLIAMVFVYALSFFHRSGLDEKLGLISYGIFLFHFGVIWGMELCGFAVNGIILLLVSNLIAIVSSKSIEYKLWTKK